jgi:hypothetical protein
MANRIPLPRRLTRLLWGPSSDRILYRAIRASEWNPPLNPLAERRNYFLTRHLTFPAGRWNREGQDALYASHDPRTAWLEKAQYVLLGADGSGSLAATDLADTMSRPLLALIRFPVIHVPRNRTYDGHGRRMAKRPDVDGLLLPRNHDFSTAWGERVGLASWYLRLIPPSAPIRHSTSRIVWNSVFYVGEGQVDPEALVRVRPIVLEHLGPADATP